MEVCRPMNERYKGVEVKVYLSTEDFTEVCKLAESAGVRRVGLPAFTQKKHGFADQKQPNRDGLSKFFKLATEFYKSYKTELEIEAKELKKRTDRLKKYGICF